MSLVSLANAHVVKFRAKAASVRDDVRVEGENRPQKTTEPQNGGVSTALDILGKYIPGEIVTLYITVVSFREQFADFGISGKPLFFFFLVMTPGLLLLAFLGNAKKTTGAVPPMRSWPYWKMFASAVAFAAWALAIPGNPWVSADHAGIASVVALLASVILGAVGKIVEPATTMTA